MKIEQIIVNYLYNAINNEDSNKRIEITIEEKKDTVRVYVFNSGKNIEENQLKKILDFLMFMMVLYFGLMWKNQRATGLLNNPVKCINELFKQRIYCCFLIT